MIHRKDKAEAWSKGSILIFFFSFVCECWWSQLWFWACCFLHAVLYWNTEWGNATALTFLNLDEDQSANLWMSFQCCPYQKAARRKVLCLLLVEEKKMLPSLLPRNWLFKLKDNLTLLFLPPTFTTQRSVKVGRLVCSSNAPVVRLCWPLKGLICWQMLATVSSLCSHIDRTSLYCVRYLSCSWSAVKGMRMLLESWDKVISFKVMRVLISEDTGWGVCCLLLYHTCRPTSWKEKRL